MKDILPKRYKKLILNFSSLLSSPLFSRPDLKVVLMSATINADLFSNYFSIYNTHTHTVSSGNTGPLAFRLPLPPDLKSFNFRSPIIHAISISLWKRDVLFCNLFLDDAPIISIPGRVFPVKEYYLENVLEMTK